MLNSLFDGEQSKILLTNYINISKNDKCKILKNVLLANNGD